MGNVRIWRKCLILIVTIGLAIVPLIGLPINKDRAVASVSLPPDAASLVQRLNALYGMMTVEEKDAVSFTRDTIRAMWPDPSNPATDTPAEQKLHLEALADELIVPVMQRIDNKIALNGGISQFPDLTKDKVMGLFLHLSILYSPDFQELAAVLSGTEYRPVLDQLAKLGGVSGGMLTLDFPDLLSFSSEIEAVVKNVVKNNITGKVTLSDLLGMINSVQQVMNNSNTVIASVFKNSSITAVDLLDVAMNFQAKEAKVLEATAAFISAYQRLADSERPSTGTDTTQNVPVIKPVTDAPKVVAEAKQVITGIQDQLNNAAPEAKAALITQLKSVVKNTVKQIGQLDTSGLLVQSSGKKQASINSTSVAVQITRILNDVASLNQLMKQIDPNAAVIKPSLEINLGANGTDLVEVTFQKSLLQSVVSNGFESVSLRSNGLSIAMNPSEFDEDVALSINASDSTNMAGTTELPLVSKVYNFNMSVGGLPVENFSSQVVIEVPLEDIGQYDEELLSFAKIVDGKLLFYGGNVVDGVLVVKRNSFSSYVVVENKVIFSDTAKVESWAGRPIEVAAAKGIVVGRGMNQFAPIANVTRAEFTAMLVRALGLGHPQNTVTFTDVGVADWFHMYVASAVKNGIVSGRTTDTFDPNAPITRTEMAVMAANALQIAGEFDAEAAGEQALDVFADGTLVPAGLRPKVALAIQAGLFVGMGQGKFEPQGTATRAQAAVVIYKLLRWQ
jgi:hypothetical protein